MNKLNFLIGTIFVILTSFKYSEQRVSPYDNPIVRLVLEKERQNPYINENALICEAVNDVLTEKVDYLNEKIELLEKRIKIIENKRFLF